VCIFFETPEEPPLDPAHLTRIVLEPHNVRRERDVSSLPAEGIQRSVTIQLFIVRIQEKRGRQNIPCFDFHLVRSRSQRDRLLRAIAVADVIGDVVDHGAASGGSSAPFG
jgi:hypothetical protein